MALVEKTRFLTFPCPVVSFIFALHSLCCPYTNLPIGPTAQSAPVHPGCVESQDRSPHNNVGPVHRSPCSAPCSVFDLDRLLRVQCSPF
ncbi:unnamed protein product [Caenorhabditis nigoni]